MTMEELAALITSLAARGPLTLVAIDGPSGAGKSTLTLALHGLFPGSQTVDLERFYSAVGVRPPDGLSPEQAFEQHVDWRAMQEQVLRPLRRGEAGRYRPYDWIAERWLDWVPVAPEGIVLVDGVYSMRPELMDFYDLTVFVDAPPAVRAERLAERPDDPVWETRWALGFDWYMDHLRTRERADVVVSGAP